MVQVLIGDPAWRELTRPDRGASPRRAAAPRTRSTRTSRSRMAAATAGHHRAAGRLLRGRAAGAVAGTAPSWFPGALGACAAGLLPGRLGLRSTTTVAQLLDRAGRLSGRPDRRGGGAGCLALARETWRRRVRGCPRWPPRRPDGRLRSRRPRDRRAGPAGPGARRTGERYRGRRVADSRGGEGIVDAR